MEGSEESSSLAMRIRTFEGPEVEELSEGRVAESKVGKVGEAREGEVGELKDGEVKEGEVE